MSPLRLAILLLAAGLPVAAQDPTPAKDPKKGEEVLTKIPDDRRDYTLLRRVTESTFVHESAGVSYTVPEGWKEIRPHRLQRSIDTKLSTVLGIERADRELVASLYWLQMAPDQTLSRWVRETATGGEYGEEYETLKVVYGKDRVTAPVRFRHNGFDVYRINIAGGPDRGDKYDGILFVFAVDHGGATWLIKARISVPKGDRARNDAWAMEVLNGFKLVPAGGLPAEPKKVPTEDDAGHNHVSKSSRADLRCSTGSDRWPRTRGRWPRSASPPRWPASRSATSAAGTTGPRTSNAPGPSSSAGLPAPNRSARPSSSAAGSRPSRRKSRPN